MKKLIKWGMLILLILFIGVQFIPKDNNRQLHISKYDIRSLYIIPDNTLKILEKSCFDCHSNNTDYPWYSKIQPVRYFLDNHIREGKNMLNFSEFGNYSERRKRNKIRSIISQIQEGKMPISTYTIIHREADLSNQDKKIIIDWFNRIK